MPAKVTLMYNLTSGGAKRPGSTESYIYLGAVSTLDDLAFIADVEAFMNARTEMMGSNIFAVGYRASFPGAKPRRSKRVLVNTDDGANIHPTPILGQGPADPGTSSLQCAGFGPDKQRSNKYLAGLPDLFITTAGAGGPNFNAAGLTNYQQQWNTWKALLIGGLWGFKALKTLPAGEPVNITSWQNQPDAPFELIMGVSSLDANWDVGSIIHVRSVLMTETWMPRPIGNFRIRSWSIAGDETLYVLRDSGSFDASSIDQPGTAETVDYEYVSYTSFGPENQSYKKRGPGPVLPVGRSKPRPRRRVF